MENLLWLFGVAVLIIAVLFGLFGIVSAGGIHFPF
jgi:hypothetical protein